MCHALVALDHDMTAAVSVPDTLGVQVSTNWYP